MSYVEDLTKVENLVSGCIYVNWHEGSGGLIYRVENVYIVFEVSQYDGKSWFSGAYDTAKEAVDQAYTFI